ncbi:MAG: hypothetical protein HY918_02330 [Candidatus Doudnabacteria bacterium]|nr:hypothetical protein [Candidatus Doudnabacteria bacterium]
MSDIQITTAEAYVLYTTVIDNKLRVTVSVDGQDGYETFTTSGEGSPWKEDNKPKPKKDDVLILKWHVETTDKKTVRTLVEARFKEEKSDTSSVTIHHRPTRPAPSAKERLARRTTAGRR